MSFQIKFHQIRAFVEVARQGSIRGASRTLNLSQPALTKSIKELEEGMASYMVFGTDLSAGHHNEKFDFDEQVMAVAIETLARTALNFPWTRGV